MARVGPQRHSGKGKGGGREQERQYSNHTAIIQKLQSLCEA